MLTVIAANRAANKTFFIVIMFNLLKSRITNPVQFIGVDDKVVELDLHNCLILFK